MAVEVLFPNDNRVNIENLHTTVGRVGCQRHGLGILQRNLHHQDSSVCKVEPSFILRK